MIRTKGQLQVDFLRSVIATGGKIARANFSVERSLGPSNPTYVLCLDQQGALSLQELPWTPELEEFLLLEHPTRMDKSDEERERFATILGNNLRTVESQFGRDHAQAVFVDLLKDHSEYDLERLIAKSPTPTPSRQSESYLACRQFLEHAIAGLQNTAILKLRYPDAPTTVALIGEALGTILDDRFHISLREQLFPR
ncbi:MAG TPA: hypothetical protein VHT91_12080 [Kofleriaceae bacterium]|jgi:hypothetical protein|nr:hypothetical protein [Kofleriaceae bacterium]